MQDGKERQTQLPVEVVEQFVGMYLDPDTSMAEMEVAFKRKAGTLYRWAFELKLTRPKTKGAQQMNLETVRRYCQAVSRDLKPAHPALTHITPMRNAKGGLDFILHLSDLHAGSYTISFNAQVYANRMNALAKRIAAKVNWFRKFTPIGKLYIFALGDFITGERVGHMTTLEELEHAVLTQIYGISVPRLVQFTRQLRPVFESIEIICVPGNHGIVAKPAVSAVSWDTVVYMGWEAKLIADEGISFDIEAVGWYKMVTVKNMDWMLIHGDQVRGGNPYGALAGASTAWHQSIPEHFDRIAAAHFHHTLKIADVFVNGTLVSDDDWSRKVVKRDGECCQVLMAVSNIGLEDVMPIWLQDITEDDEDFRL